MNKVYIVILSIFSYIPLFSQNNIQNTFFGVSFGDDKNAVINKIQEQNLTIYYTHQDDVIIIDPVYFGGYQWKTIQGRSDKEGGCIIFFRDNLFYAIKFYQNNYGNTGQYSELIDALKFKYGNPIYNEWLGWEGLNVETYNEEYTFTNSEDFTQCKLFRQCMYDTDTWNISLLYINSAIGNAYNEL